MGCMQRSTARGTFRAFRPSEPVQAALVTVCLSILTVSCSGAQHTDLLTSEVPAIDGTDEAALECANDYPSLEEQLQLLSEERHFATLALPRNRDPFDPERLPSEVPVDDMFAIVTLKSAVFIDEIRIPPEFEAASATIYHENQASSPSVEAVTVKADGHVVWTDNDQGSTAGAMVVGFAVPIKVASQHEERLRETAHEVLLWPYSTLLPIWDVPINAVQQAANESTCPPPSALTHLSEEVDEAAAYKSMSIVERARIGLWLYVHRFDKQRTVSDTYDRGTVIVRLRDPIQLADFDPTDEPTAFSAELDFAGYVHYPASECSCFCPCPRPKSQNMCQNLSRRCPQPQRQGQSKSPAATVSPRRRQTCRGTRSLRESCPIPESSACITDFRQPWTQSRDSKAWRKR